MKVLIAYDGSDYADTAIDDLRWAGLPGNAEAIVLSVVEWPLQAPRSWGMVETGFAAELEEDIKAAERLATQGRERLQKIFPTWKIHAAASPAGHAATAILDKANAWPADLIVAGTHGRSALARAVLGSVSLKLVKEAHCSVRIARQSNHDGPIRLLLGNDGSPEGNAVVDEVSRRFWPAGTEARVLGVHEIFVSAESATIGIASDVYGKINEDERLRLGDTVNHSVERLHNAGVAASSSVKDGDPKGTLVSEARNWKASAIFIGARGLGRAERILLGSVSSAAVAHASCTVEVVRHK
jgi:nucleotide-binding universal stress UspA family protein